ncbi:uncharacterized protein ASCRUDRAFT_6157 [Ascoidea rubescens DSM 1968]|uniref:Extracellular membrane protein CFEM domain-containing protein n=1 Tax=Ascoidea rubescens DSM 1968 TaxID=1344418 RepID=A0A1D2VRT9_9ASCO|nr:hypothetical protein ASCRUDRAFT_6157 [Ascoidea rubescens DSM 1968]ODV64316.1 hypothetical protein ASCRUDRAFT_6157 [Ascoidea rubescens DSM 1968]
MRLFNSIIFLSLALKSLSSPVPSNNKDSNGLEPQTLNQNQAQELENLEQYEGEPDDFDYSTANEIQKLEEENLKKNQVEWPKFWCEKQCRETYLLYKGCELQGDLIGETCTCSPHFRYKINKCTNDGCDHFYDHAPEWQEKIEPLIEYCKDKGDDFVNY